MSTFERPFWQHKESLFWLSQTFELFSHDSCMCQALQAGMEASSFKERLDEANIKLHALMADKTDLEASHQAMLKEHIGKEEIAELQIQSLMDQVKSLEKLCEHSKSELERVRHSKTQKHYSVSQM
jgi:hypothetical protein